MKIKPNKILHIMDIERYVTGVAQLLRIKSHFNSGKLLFRSCYIKDKVEIVARKIFTTDSLPDCKRGYVEIP